MHWSGGILKGCNQQRKPRLHGAGIPLTTARGADVQPVQFTGDFPRALLVRPPDRHQIEDMPRGLLHHTGGVGQFEGIEGTGMAQICASGLGPRQRRFRPRRDHLALVFDHGGWNVDGQPVGGRCVHRDKIHAALHQVGDERHSSRQPVESGNRQVWPPPAALRQRGVQPRAVRVAASIFDLGKHGGEGLTGGKESRTLCETYDVTVCNLPDASNPNENRYSPHKNPTDSHGNAATAINATTSAKIYGQILHNASSGDILQIARAP